MLIRIKHILLLFCLIVSINAEDSNDNIESNTKESKNTDKNYKLESLITTGSALSSDVSQIPGNMSVVDSKSINSMPNNKISDVVKKLAGVRIENDGSYNPRPQIKIRGINFGTLVMLDGVILSDLEGEARLLNQISLFDVKRVEVARGAFSSLYGTGAIGGVINFITNMPDKLGRLKIAKHFAKI
ncbi:TonB-dependent receptor plug domain-containing protein [Helicobacter saguini]|uniref:Plug domain-containing protein n=1 Tax=Helicobacter saguini TaxID=1548018 RepID=A0A347VQ52_9HELI|nr:Plug domain-containing protein [Helicobacter saguini]MWV61076.1 TonB-dependent receptor plug domain-containing protein [Helicobacter saguini]MWV68255.1 TonB-dependent receptor plug domain-containing protein [Helicobacter saguini]MWV70281.1 TonB-dependent receptor plug domain-containing protein [Helicobacter saguini]MWV72183.1 TonB-dependent receptor plug domain-containing protein [Helicobacter saguini]TLD95239.1 Plug domain-containing protein [Helicobacter saguini]